jgi:hypothetical protein
VDKAGKRIEKACRKRLRSGNLVIARLLEAVDQPAGIIDQRILDHIRGDTHGDQKAAVAALRKQHARPSAARRSLLFSLTDHPCPLQFGSDRRNRRGGQPRMLRYIGMRELPQAPQRRKHERAVLLTHQFGARFTQHYASLLFTNSTNTCSSQSICPMSNGLAQSVVDSPEKL